MIDATVDKRIIPGMEISENKIKEIDSKLDIMSRNIEGLRKDNQTNSTKLDSLTAGVEKLIQLALKILNRNYSNQ